MSHTPCHTPLRFNLPCTPVTLFPLSLSLSLFFFFCSFCFVCTYWRKQCHPTPVLLPGKSHERRSLVGCSPWGREESDMTEWLHFHFSLLCIGEGNGNPLQCSFLENPKDEVAQNQKRLKWLSSSSISLCCPL